MRHIFGVDVASRLRGEHYKRYQAAAALVAADSSSEAAAYYGLHASSLDLCGYSDASGGALSVNLLVPEFKSSSVFAGLRTAFIVGGLTALRLERKLRVLVMASPPSTREQTELYGSIRRVIPTDVALELQYHQQLTSTGVDRRDYWIATYWTTAHALDIACRIGQLDSRRVIYLVQDYEPSFYPYSTEASLIEATLRAGFTVLVNSSPLASFMRRQGLEVSDEFVFQPQLDFERLRAARVTRDSRAAKRRSPSRRIFFYGRPSKPRNMFSLGVATLRILVAMAERHGVAVEIVSAGEPHGNVRLGSDKTLRALGVLSWAGYFEELGQADVVLSLQATPHPSHPPLDAILGGAFAVTNNLGGTRHNLHKRLLAGEADPRILADLALRSLGLTSEGTFEEDMRWFGSLGRNLDDVVDTAADSLRST